MPVLAFPKIGSLGATALIGTTVIFTLLFYKRASPEHRQQVEGFFGNLATPLNKGDVAVHPSIR